MNVTDRVSRVEPSATLAIASAAKELEAAGEDVIDLSVGEPDFPTPEPIVEAGKAALDAGHTGYPPSQGIPALREAIADSLCERGVSASADEVLVTPGAKQALYEVVQSLIQAGDEVVLLDPAWVSYEAMVSMAGGTLVRIDLSATDFQLEPALPALEGAVSEETDLLILNSPSNPSGAVYSEAAIQRVRDLAVEYDVTVIADEIYREITYGVEPVSLGSLDGMADRTVTVDGFSKAYSMTGWRLGYFHGPPALVEQAGKLHSHSVSSAANFVQRAGLVALEEVDDAVDEMRSAFRERRDLVVDLLGDAGVEVAVPEGAFYLMVPVEGADLAWCEGAIEDAHVAMVPGTPFGTPGFVRMSYAAGRERLKEGVERLVETGYL